MNTYRDLLSSQYALGRIFSQSLPNICQSIGLQVLDSRSAKNGVSLHDVGNLSIFYCDYIQRRCSERPEDVTD